MYTPPASPPNRSLGIYMNDQLASGLVFREVARRAARANAGTESGRALARVAAEIAEDIDTFERLMERLGLQRSRMKPRLAIVTERLTRLKLNGRLLAYSPLSRFVELDFW
jgi:hypothetical protein